MNQRITNHLHLAIQAILLLPPAVYFGIILHELAHGIGALLAGGRFHGFHATFISGATFNSGLDDTWGKVFSSLSGSGASFLVGLFLFLAILPRLRRWEFQMFWSYVCFVTLIDLPRYMFTTAVDPRGGDFSKIAEILHIPTILFGIAGALSIGVVVFLSSIIFSRLISGRFSLATYWQRLSAFSLLLFLPGIFLAIIASKLPFHRMTGVRGFITFSLTALLVTVFMAVRKTRSSEPTLPVPKTASFTALGVFAIALIVWQVVFGNAPTPRGLIWSALPEQQVSCWNLRLTISSDFAIRADFLMRPNVIDMIWEKQKVAEPYWQPYDSLARVNSTSLIPSVRWNLLDRNQDDTTFYSLFGFDRRGARRISYTGTLLMDSVSRAPSTRVLTLDFDSIIFPKEFCWLEIQPEGNITLQSCDLVPAESRKPLLQTEHRLQFESSTLNAVKSIRVVLTRH